MPVDLRVSPAGQTVSPGLGQQSGWICPWGQVSSFLGDPCSTVLSVGSVLEPQVSVLNDLQFPALPWWEGQGGSQGLGWSRFGTSD